MQRLIKIAVGVLVGMIVDAVVQEALGEADVPPHVAKVIGGIAGAIV